VEVAIRLAEQAAETHRGELRIATGKSTGKSGDSGGLSGERGLGKSLSC
jgi:hypothetical protein